MNKEPLFSVLMANYNNAGFIGAAINSVKAQTYRNWELVIVDDASTDQSWEIITSYSEADERIKIYRNEINIKVGAIKARCAKMATGEICGILDPDDLITPDALETMVTAHQAHPDCSLISSDLYLCDEELNVLESECYLRDTQKYDSYLEDHDGSIHHFWTFKKSYYLKTKGFSSKYILAEDQDLFYKLEEVGQTQVINKKLYYYRTHSRSISRNDNSAIAFTYHLYSMFDAIERRGDRITSNEKDSVWTKFDGFLNWGYIEIPLKEKIIMLFRFVKYYPKILFERSLYVSFYGAYRKWFIYKSFHGSACS